MREVKNAAENQAPKRDHRRKKKNQAPDKVWQEDEDREQRNRSGVNGRRDHIWEGGAEEEMGSGHGQSGLERPREVTETARNCQGLGRVGCASSSHLGFSPAALGLGPAWGPHCLCHRPCNGSVAACFCQNPARSTTCRLPASGLSHDRISTTPGQGRQLGASTGRNLGQTTSGGLFTRGLRPRPLSFRPHPLTAQGRLAPPLLPPCRECPG